MGESILAGKKGLIIPIVLAVVALLLTMQYLKQREAALGLRAEPRPVLVAKVSIPKLTRLDETLVEVMEVPRQFIQPAALTAAKEAVNQVTTAPILKGEQVLGTKLVAYGVETGLAIKVPKGLRAVTLATDDVTGVAGLIRPGDYVDVLGIFEFGDTQKSDKKTFTVLQSVLVLAVERMLGVESEAAQAKTLADQEEAVKSGRTLTEGFLPRGKTVTNATLAVTPEQAQGLVLAQSTGRLYLTLRSMFEERRATPLEATDIFKLLGVKEKIMFDPRQWSEIRGTQVNQ